MIEQMSNNPNESSASRRIRADVLAGGGWSSRCSLPDPSIICFHEMVADQAPAGASLAGEQAQQLRQQEHRGAGKCDHDNALRVP